MPRPLEVRLSVPTVCAGVNGGPPPCGPSSSLPARGSFPQPHLQHPRAHPQHLQPSAQHQQQQQVSSARVTSALAQHAMLNLPPPCLTSPMVTCPSSLCSSPPPPSSSPPPPSSRPRPTCDGPPSRPALPASTWHRSSPLPPQTPPPPSPPDSKPGRHARQGDRQATCLPTWSD